MLLVLVAVVRSVKVRGIRTVEILLVTLEERVTQEVTPSGCTLPGGLGVSSRYEVVQDWVPSLMMTKCVSVQYAALIPGLLNVA